MPAGRYMEQEFCDWCFDELSAESMALSRELGLCDVDCCACDRCLEVSAFLTAPKGWTVPGICLPKDHPWNCYATGRSHGPNLTPSPQDPPRGAGPTSWGHRTTQVWFIAGRAAEVTYGLRLRAGAAPSAGCPSR